MEIEYNNKTFIIDEYQGRMYISFNGIKIAELVNGRESLIKSHSNDIKKWIENIKKRDLKRLSNIADQIKSLESQREFIIGIWGDNN